MRCVVFVAMVALGLAQSAFAADLGILRGSFAAPAAYKNWEGFYIGGQVGVGGGGADFGNEGSSLVGTIIAHTFLADQGVASWATGGRADTGHAAQYGALIGYNAQWDDVVIGVEANYYRTNLSANAGGRTPPVGYILLTNGDWQYPTYVSGGSSISLTDFGTLRARFGWAVDRFLPYFTGGVALGRASYATTATAGFTTLQYIGSTSPTPAPPTGPWSATLSEGKTNALIYGWSAGLGMDIALTQNIFIRGEYEFIQFSQMRLNLNNARVGAGLRF
jgi:outer membrane immunogenic protein